ncbi:hypothetical protein HDU84_006380 [Entophlyctis sp. JEL0112]|nr:hypothetical protein HDU84_006380 [Entophlyctis sp. JEL0112]
MEWKGSRLKFNKVKRYVLNPFFKEIQSRIAELDFEDCKVLVSNVDSQLSHNGCIVIMVLGEMSNKQAASHKFCQCFVLAEQPSGYFVYNDIFRFLKEDIDNEYEEPSDPFGNVDYYHNQQHQHPFNAHSHHPALDIAPQAPAVATQTPSASAARAPSPVPAALPFQRGRSPSPKKLETPQPAATILAAPADALEKTRSPSLAAAAISETAVLVPATPPTSADKKGSDAFAGSWAESVPTPVVENVAATTSKNQEAIPSSPAKAQVAAAVGAKKKNQAQASSVANAVGSPLESVAPAKPKTWATLAAGGAVATAATGSGAAVNVVEKPESPNPVAGKTEIKAPLNKAGVPLVVKKMPIPQGSPSSPGGSANDEQIEFREVQRKPASGPHGGNNSNVNGNRNYNNHQYQQKQLTKEDYLRSIFFMLPQDIPGVNGGPTSSSLDEVIIRDFFTKSVGPVVEVMIPRGKPLCFVEFVDAATAALAIGKTVVINGKSITPEQRKPRYTGNNPNNSNHNNGAARGGMRYNNSRVNAANGGGPRPQSQYGQAAAGV